MQISVAPHMKSSERKKEADAVASSLLSDVDE